MIVCRDVEASDGVSIRTLVESCIRVKRFPQADVGLNPKENAVAELWIQSSAFFRGNVEMSTCKGCSGMGTIEQN